MLREEKYFKRRTSGEHKRFPYIFCEHLSHSLWYKFGAIKRVCAEFSFHNKFRRINLNFESLIYCSSKFSRGLCSQFPEVYCKTISLIHISAFKFINAYRRIRIEVSNKPRRFDANISYL